MRMTQYIGLTQKAKDWLKTLELIPQNQKPNTLGMFDEHVDLKYWVGFVEDCLCEVWEVVQMSPWSSGPMFLTQLELRKNGEKTLLFPWKKDQNVKGQVDTLTGTFWI